MVPQLTHKIQTNTVFFNRREIAYADRNVLGEASLAHVKSIKRKFPQKPLTELPFGNASNELTRTLVDTIIMRTSRIPLDAGAALSIATDLLITGVICLLTPSTTGDERRIVNFSDLVSFRLDSNIIRSNNELLTAERLFMRDNGNDDGTVKYVSSENELVIPAVTLLRHLGLDARVARISGPENAAEATPPKVESFGVAVLDENVVPHIRTFAMTGIHPPMDEIAILSDEAVLAVLHALDASNKVRKLKESVVMKASEAIVNYDLRQVMIALKPSLEIWPNNGPGHRVLSELYEVVPQYREDIVKTLLARQINV
ncbi:MAG: hypothetical protein Q7S22_03985 [Candidatus Micrarchaeota archaeon]|nr:hypothetical protein [Candidatus Micrarchaeota archaeon]